MESSAYSCFLNPISAISGFQKAVQKNLEEKKQAAINPPPHVDTLRWYKGQLRNATPLTRLHVHGST